ncbi:MAG: hypothetical protein D6806_12255 [Deltaproteobacteria bacterium]|nr:MAG: hypothetical protein D6806_12255 [Deltaproteobacteria bacterium]
MKGFSAIALFLVAVLTFPQGAGARGACRDDIARFCKGVPPGKGRIVTCLWSNRDRLSADCKAQTKRRFRKLLGVSVACHADYKKFCADVVPGGGRIAACLARHSAELTNPVCKAEVEKGKDAVKSMVPGICAKDAKRFCAGIKPGGGRIRSCLVSNVDRLSRPCKMRVKRWIRRGIR